MKLRKPFDGDYGISCDFQCHCDRNPPSSAPGIDWKLPKGTMVLAAAPGIVYRARYGGAGGKHIRILHAGGAITLYAHLAALVVPEDTRVLAGEVIGLSGNTGHSTGPHLHFAVQVDGVWVDPAPMMEVME